MIVDGRVHKLGEVGFDYTSGDYMRPWRFRDDDGRLDLTFTPFFERVAKTDMVVIRSEVHQMIGHFDGMMLGENGEAIEVRRAVGWAEDHHARW